jgi:hypothetical protein
VNDQPKPIAIVVRDYPSLRKALDARRRELGWTMLELDHRSGLQDGYSAKLLGPNGSRHFGKMSFEVMLAALGVEIVVRPTCGSLLRQS